MKVYVFKICDICCKVIKVLVVVGVEFEVKDICVDGLNDDEIV